MASIKYCEEMKLSIENGPVLYLNDFREMDWEIHGC